MIWHRFTQSLRLKVTLVILLPLLVLLGVFTSIASSRHREAVLDNLSVVAGHTSQVIESSLNHAMLNSDFTEVQAVLDTIGQRSEFNVTYLLDPSGEIIFAPQGEHVGAVLSNNHPDCLPCHGVTVTERPESIIIQPDGSEERFFRSMQPILNRPECTECHDSNERILGLLLTDISMAPLEDDLAADLREDILWWLATIATSLLVVNITLDRVVLRRIDQLVDLMKRVGRGEFITSQPKSSTDEIGILSQSFHTMTQRVQQREQENEALSESLRQQSEQRRDLYQRVITVQEEERKRVARDLHDQLGQALSGLAFQAQAVENLLDRNPASAREQLVVMRGQVADTTQHMYDLIYALRPSILDDMGLVAAVRAYAESSLRERQIAYTLTADMPERLPSTIETSLYRFYQEGITNIIRHAKASTVLLELRQDAGGFHGLIRDDGQGFNLAAIDRTQHDGRGLGLLGMQERIAGCGGTIEINSQHGQGTTIRIHIPLKEVPDD